MVDQGNVNVYIPDYRQKAVHVNVYINITNFPVDVKWLDDFGNLSSPGTSKCR